MFSLSAPIAGYAAVKVGERWSVVVGAGRPAVSMLVFTQVGANPSVVLIIVALALSGLGNGVSTPSTASSAANEVAPDELGVMSAAQLLITQIGIVAGIQVMVTVQASSNGGAGTLSSFHTAYLVGALAALAAVVCGFFVKDTPRGSRKATVEVVDPLTGGPAAGCRGPATRSWPGSGRRSRPPSGPVWPTGGPSAWRCPPRP